MAFLTLQTQEIPNWQYGGSTATLYIWASQPFYEQSTGEYVPQGQVNNVQNFCQAIECSVSGTVLTIPEVVLATTTDSTVPNATYTAIIATSSGALVYPLLEQFFVDPEYFQTPIFYAVSVEDAGTADANGVYTYRGQFASLPYYNLVGEATSEFFNAIVADGAQWTITADDGSVLYSSNTYPSLPYNATYAVSAGASPAPTVSQNTDYVYGTWEQLTISNQGVSAVPLGWPGPFWNVQQTKEYVNSLVGDGTTPFASASVAGKTRLDTNPAVTVQPIAVGVNSNRIEKNLSSDYGNSFTTAISEIGSDDVTLIVKNPVTVASNTTIPANITLNIIDEGLITVNANITLTIGSMIDPGSRQIFAPVNSTANVRFSLGAVSHIDISWWVALGGTCTDALNEALASCSANGGGAVFIPEADWETAGGHVVPSRTTVFGVSPKSKLTATGNGTGILVMQSATYYVNIRDLALDGGGFTIAAFLCSGTVAGGASGQLYFNNVHLQNATYGFRIRDTAATDWQMAQVFFDGNCSIRSNTYGLYCNSSNNVLSCEAFFEVGVNQYAAYIQYCGQWSFIGCEFAGSPYLGAWQIESQTIVAAAGVTGDGIAESVVTAAGMAGSPVTVSVPVNTNMATADDVADAFREALGADPSVTSFFHIGGTGAEVQLIALDPAANDGTMNFTINTGTATGITNSALSSTVAAGVADSTQAQGVEIENAHGVINFIGTVDEGFRNFLINEASDLNSVINFVGATIQAPIRLNESCTLNTTNCNIVDRTVRNSLTSAAQYCSVGDMIPAQTFFSGAFRTLSARVPHNFNGNPLTGGSCTAVMDVNQDGQRVISQYSNRIYQATAQGGDPLSKARFEVMSAVDPGGGNYIPLVRVGRCTDTGNPLFYYDIYRDYATGYLHFVGNQAGSKAYNFDAQIDVPAVSINGGTALTTTNRTGSGNLVLANSPTLVTPVLGAATGTSLALGGGTALTTTNRTGTGNLVLATSPTLTTPNIGVASGTSLAVSGAITSSGGAITSASPTAGIGYATGAGGAQTQLTSKSTTVVSNTITTAVTMNNANLVAGTAVSFTFTNSSIAATDQIIVTRQSGGTAGAYAFDGIPGVGSATITVRNLTAGDLAEAIVLRITVLKTVSL